MGPDRLRGGVVLLVGIIGVSMLRRISSAVAAAPAAAALLGGGSFRQRSAALLSASLAPSRAFVSGPGHGRPTRSHTRVAAAPAGASSSSSRRQQQPRSDGGKSRPRPDADQGAETPEAAAVSFPTGPHVRLRSGKARLFLEGNPLVYGEAVEAAVGGVRAGDYVDVVDGKGNLIGKGVYNPGSMYRVRLLWHAREKGERAHAETLEGIVRRRVATAWATRQALGLPNAETDCFRLINGEGDRLSGLAVDVFGPVCVAVSSALWCERHKGVIIGALEAQLAGAGIRVVWRRSEARLKQDGVEEEEAKEKGDVPMTDVKAAALEEGAFVWGREHGLQYKIFPELGQKTGFYADQRENRAVLGSLAKGKRVLDLFCYTGGYALAAGRGGAAAVVGVDSSALAVETAVENARANGLADTVSFVKSDVLEFVRAQGEEGDGLLFDIVVADPPKLAPTRRDLPRALHKYGKINRAAISLLQPGGLLLTHTCSAALTQSPEVFKNMVRKSANDVGRSLTVLRVTHAAPCHVMNPSYPENEYLTAMLCVVV